LGVNETYQNKKLVNFCFGLLKRGEKISLGDVFSFLGCPNQGVGKMLSLWDCVGRKPPFDYAQGITL